MEEGCRQGQGDIEDWKRDLWKRAADRDRETTGTTGRETHKSDGLVSLEIG